jgi:FkbM family methyltransferase
MERGDRALILLSKHIFFAPVLCDNFDVFAHALPTEVRDGVAIVDFARNPDAFNQCRLSLQHGVTLDSAEGSFRLKKDRRVMIISPRHLVYSADIAKQFDIYFSPLVPRERDGELVLDFSRPGNLQRYAKSGLEFEMASFPEEEEAIEEYFRWYRPQRGDLVFDIGAHCGVSTHHLARLVGPEGRVVAFEPDPGNFAILQRNLERHGLRNVEAQNLAVAGNAGRLAFNAEGTIGSSLSSLMQRASVGETVMVDAVTLADAFARWGTPAFCKIDIEGAEVDALAAAGEVLRKCPTNLALDTNHPRADGSTTEKPVESLLSSYGYEVASEANPLLTTWARPLRTPQQPA